MPDPRRNERSARARAIVPAAVAFVAACGGLPGPTGDVHVAASRDALGATAARVTVTVTAGDGPAFPALVAPLSVEDGVFEGWLSDVPAGPGRLFEIAAYDLAGVPIARGTGKGDVVAGAMAAISVIVGPCATPAVAAAVPVLDLLAASATEAAPGGVIVLRASAHDPAASDGVAYRWDATCGTFDDPAAAAVAWTAPASAGRCDLSLTVSAARGGSVTVGLAVAVLEPP